MNYINDVALYNKSEVGTSVNGVVEICPQTSNKRELREPGFDKLITVRQVIGEYPFYYGSFPQTLAGDKDPLDMILFTDKAHSELDLVKVDVIGAIKTLDAGEQDDKIICVEHDCQLLNVKKELKKALKFLKRYKGKDADMIIDKKLASMYEADNLVENAHQEWIKVRQSKTNIIIQSTTKRNTNVISASRS